MVFSPFADEVAACRIAQRAWAARSVRERLRAVRELRLRIVERAEELFAAERADTDRTSLEVLATELLPVASALKFLEREAARILRPRKIRRGQRPLWLFGCRDIVHRRPWGIVGVIGTWNYPIYLNVGPIAAALVAGNGVLWKPSENAPRTAAVIHRLFLESGFPPQLFQMLPATREAGPLLAEADVDHIVFTGSDAVGRKLAARLGERLIPSTLELSGCDAMFVLEDADVTLAAKAAFFGFTMNRGQTCIAVRRIFVHQSIAMPLLKGLLMNHSDVSSLVTPGQYEQSERLLQDAMAKRASIFQLSPLPRPEDFEALRAAKPGEEPAFIRRIQESKPGELPRVIISGTDDLAICREASFAPLCVVLTFDSIEEALARAAQCPFGLSASIFSVNRKAAQELAARIPAGSVIVNDLIAPTAHPATPFGGRGSSGWGVTQGPEGLLAMTVPQVVSVRRWKFVPHIDEAVNPDPKATTDIMRGLLRASHARGWRAWLGGVRQLLRGIRRKNK